MAFRYGNAKDRKFLEGLRWLRFEIEDRIETDMRICGNEETLTTRICDDPAEY